MFELFCNHCLEWFSSDDEIDDCVDCGAECCVYEFGDVD